MRSFKRNLKELQNLGILIRFHHISVKSVVLLNYARLWVGGIVFYKHISSSFLEHADVVDTLPVVDIHLKFYTVPS